jgi:DNA-binding NtrC family response regulator
VSGGPRYRILLVEDDPGVRFGIRSFLEAHGYDVEEADTCQAAEASFRSARPDAAILDYLLPDGNTLDVLPRLKAIDAGVPSLILTAHASIDLAVRAIKEGAEQFLTKPVELPALLVVLQRMLDSERSRKRDLAVQSRQARDRIDPFLGRSSLIRRLAEEARRVLGSDSPLLLLGETGTGKGVLARWLHQNSPRCEEAFVDLNCAGLSRELLDSELFGHEKGAFTGAAGAKPGLLEVAHRGNVFLDEIGDMDPEVQAKLLKVVEEKRFRRLGDVRDRRIDIRLIAATHQDLAALVRQKRFRNDLFFRISGLPLRVPALRERLEDIAPLARSLLDGLAAELGRGSIQLSEATVELLQRYPWPGNVRELRNVLERAVLLNDRSCIEPQDLRFEPAPGSAGGEWDSRLTLEEIERLHIARVLQEEGGRVEQAAHRLGVPRSSLYQKIKRHGLRPSRI